MTGPILIEVFGCRYVAFRDTNGVVGLLDELPHRHASLLYGRNENCGLTCLYHGWKFDVSGKCVGMPSEPKGSDLITKVRHNAYQTREWGAFVWAWLGNEDDIPEFQPPAFAPTADTKVSVTKIRIPANWAQIMEGQIDSSVVQPPFVIWYPRVEEPRLMIKRVRRRLIGRPECRSSGPTTVIMAIRHPIKPALNEYFRVTEYIAPFTCLIPPNSSYNVTKCRPDR